MELLARLKGLGVRCAIVLEQAGQRGTDTRRALVRRPCRDHRRRARGHKAKASAGQPAGGNSAAGRGARSHRVRGRQRGGHRDRGRGGRGLRLRHLGLPHGGAAARLGRDGPGRRRRGAGGPALSGAADGDCNRAAAGPGRAAGLGALGEQGPRADGIYRRAGGGCRRPSTASKSRRSPTCTTQPSARGTASCSRCCARRTPTLSR